jgi:hypothetical protein
MDKALVTFEELDSELALELPERQLLQCNNANGICVNVDVRNNNVCAAIGVITKNVSCTVR